MSAQLCIVDYGVGNRRSVEKAFEKVGAQVVISADPNVIESADGLVLPGVGSFPSAMKRIRELGQDQAIIAAAGRDTPILGTCLGMQVLLERSGEHGGADGLGLVAGEVLALDAGGAKLPHIGWSNVQWSTPSPLTAGLGEAASFYHVHSFVTVPGDPDVVVGWSTYGSRFASVIAKGNIYGVQFHPEKSSADGLQMLANFCAICESQSR